MPDFAFDHNLSENAPMSGRNSTNPHKLIGWTLLFLSLSVFLFYNFLKRSGPVPSEEMQVREAEQRAHQQLNSN
jgi:hypothetical protein